MQPSKLLATQGWSLVIGHILVQEVQGGRGTGPQTRLNSPPVTYKHNCFVGFIVFCHSCDVHSHSLTGFISLLVSGSTVCVSVRFNGMSSNSADGTHEEHVAVTSTSGAD